MNVITIEFCAEDRARLDKLQATLDKMTFTDGVVLEGVVEAAAAEPAPAETIPAEQERPADGEPEPEAAPEPKPEVVKVERSDIQKKVVTLSQAGKKDAVRSIVTAYGNTKVSDIPEDKLLEVLEKLTALEG